MHSWLPPHVDFEGRKVDFRIDSGYEKLELTLKHEELTYYPLHLWVGISVGNSDVVENSNAW